MDSRLNPSIPASVWAIPITDHSHRELNCPVWSYLAKRDGSPLMRPVTNEAVLAAWTLLQGLPREPHTPTGTHRGFPLG